MILTESEEEAYRAELARLRSGIFNCDEAERERRHARMVEIKAILELVCERTSSPTFRVIGKPALL